MKVFERRQFQVEGTGEESSENEANVRIVGYWETEWMLLEIRLEFTCQPVFDTVE